MRPGRSVFLSLLIAVAAPLTGTLVAGDAAASVSVAVTLEGLLQETTLAVVATPVEGRAVWENNRIYTYTRIRLDRVVAGDAPKAGDGNGAAQDVWVRTMGGIVGKIGQIVDGEPVLTPGRSCLLFLHPGPVGSYEVTARAQGQYPVIVDERGQSIIIKSSAVGTVLQPHAARLARAHTVLGAVGPVPLPMMAADAIHNRPLEEALRDVAAAYKRVHAG